MKPPRYAGPIHRSWHYTFRIICGAGYVFLVVPVIVIVPLSFNAEPFFTFTEKMLTLDPEGYSLRWYVEIFENPNWLLAIQNSVVVAISATAIATTLGTLAALGLSEPRMPYRTVVMSVLMFPLIVPLIVTAVGTYFFYSKLGLVQSLPGLIVAHAVLGTPFVVITVTATLSGFDRTLLRAAAGLGARPTRTFFKITMPLIRPGIISGALFAFIISFDEPVVVLFLAGFEQRTIPVQMWSGIREKLSPDILAVASLLVLLSIILLTTVELLRRHTERLRGRQ